MTSFSTSRIVSHRGTAGLVSAAIVLGVLLIATLLTRSVQGQTRGNTNDDTPLTGTALRQASLEWLDQYLVDSSLISREDIKTIHQTVANMSDSQLRQWLDQTKELRAYVASDQWQATKKWLREFLKVQAIYSDEEIKQLREKILDADADQMLSILKEIQKKHASLNWMHQASVKSRSATLKGRNDAVARQAAAAKKASASTRGNRPLFGNTQGYAASRGKVNKGYQVPRPLITSREVARWSVFRGIW